MHDLPWEIKVANSPLARGLAYLGAFLVMLCGVSFAVEGYFENGWLVGSSSVVIGILLFIIITKIGKKRNKKIEITLQGITQVRGNETIFISWVEEHQAYYDATQFTTLGVIPIGTEVKTQVVAKGRRIKIDYPMDDFHKTVIALSSSNVGPLIDQQIKNGLTVHFGPVQLSKDHIIFKKKKYQRHEITKLKVADGKVILKLKGQWFPTKIFVREIGNYLILLRLLDPESKS